MTNSENGREALSIRELREEDVPAAKSLIRRVWREQFGSHPDLFVRNLLDSHDALRDIDEHARIYAIPDGAFVIALAGAELVGTGGLVRTGKRAGELRRLSVAAAHRRRGLATMIAEELLAIAGDLQLAVVRVSMNEELSASRNFFQFLGFAEVASEDGLVRMEKQLAESLDDE